MISKVEGKIMNKETVQPISLPTSLDTVSVVVIVALSFHILKPQTSWASFIDWDWAFSSNVLVL